MISDTLLFFHDNEPAGQASSPLCLEFQADQFALEHLLIPK